jgi:hypothetical protein
MNFSVPVVHMPSYHKSKEALTLPETISIKLTQTAPQEKEAATIYPNFSLPDESSPEFSGGLNL